MPGKWSKGKVCVKSAKACDVHPNTAFRWRHRFFARPNDSKPTRLADIAEADEAFSP